MRYPTMTFRNYILKHASETFQGMFYCNLCRDWFEKQRWPHFKKFHRFSGENKP